MSKKSVCIIHMEGEDHLCHFIVRKHTRWKMEKTGLETQHCKVNYDSKGFQCSQRSYSCPKGLFNFPISAVAHVDNISQNILLFHYISLPFTPPLVQMAQRSSTSKCGQLSTKRLFPCTIILKPRGCEETKVGCCCGWYRLGVPAGLCQCSAVSPSSAFPLGWTSRAIRH